MDISALRSRAGPASFSTEATMLGFTANRIRSQPRHSWLRLGATWNPACSARERARGSISHTAISSMESTSDFTMAFKIPVAMLP